MDILWFVLIVALVGALGVLAGAGRDDPRQRRRWEAAFHAETHRQVHTDATGVLMCRRCGASGSERAGRCPACGAVL